MRTESAFLFRVGAEWFALPTSVCERVVDISRTHSVPHRRNGVLIGLGSIAGDLLAVISLPALLGIDDASVSSTPTRSLLFTWKNTRFAMPVAELYGVHRFHPEDRVHTPSTLPDHTAYTTSMLAWNGRMAGYLDANRLHAGIVRGIA